MAAPYGAMNRTFLNLRFCFGFAKFDPTPLRKRVSRAACRGVHILYYTPPITPYPFFQCVFCLQIAASSCVKCLQKGGLCVKCLQIDGFRGFLAVFGVFVVGWFLGG